MKNKTSILTAIFLAFACALLPVEAKEGNPQVNEATAFFNQLIEKTDNPYIASMAQESLKRLQGNVPATAGKRQVEIPLMTQMNHGLAVPVLLENNVMSTFIVDTGATYTVITPRVAKKLGVVITPETPRISIATANGVIHAPMVKINRVAIGDIEVRDVPVIVQDLGNNVILSGLLGMNFFKNMDLTIQHNKLILSVNQTS